MSSIFVPQTVKGNKGHITQETIQRLLDENGHLIQCIVDNQSSGNIRESAQYQQILHRNLVWLATVADSNQTGNQHSSLSSPKTGVSATIGSPKPARPESSIANLPPPPRNETPTNTHVSRSATPKSNGIGSNPPTPQPPYASPQPHRASPQTKPNFAPQQQQGSFPPQYHHSPTNSSGTRTPLRSPVDPSQSHNPVHRQSPMTGTQQYPPQQQTQLASNTNQASPFSQPPSSYPQPTAQYNDQTMPHSSNSYSQQMPHQQSAPASYTQAPGYNQPPSYPQHPSYPPQQQQQQQPAQYGSQPNSFPPNATAGSQVQPPNNYQQALVSQPQYPSSSHQGMMQNPTRPYYGRPGPPPTSVGYPGYNPAPQNHQMPPPEQQQMIYQSQPPQSNYPPQYANQQPHQGMQYGQNPPQSQPPGQSMPYQQR